MGEKIQIEIRGKNNEKISDAILNIAEEDRVDDREKRLIYNNKKIIIEKFLEKMDKKAIINTAIGVSKKRNIPSLWTPDYRNESYFGGVVGVIEDELRINLGSEEFTPMEDRDPLENGEIIHLIIRLQITSRFDTEKPYFLATMLLRDKIKVNDNMVLSNEDDLYDYMLLFWYKTRLLEAYEQGLYKTYRRFETNSERLRGAIDISQHIRLNAGQNNGKIASFYHENTLNNYLNHLIILAYEYMKKKYPELIEQNIDNDLDLKSIIESIRCEIGYNPLNSRVVIKENNKPISHPYFIGYEELRRICMKILRDEGISIWDANEERTKSILFYIPDLWELYLEDKIKANVRIGRDLYSQGKTPGGDDAIKVFGAMEATKNREFEQPTYPDFVFFNGQTPYFILDAKFKKGWNSSIATEEKNAKIGDLSDYDKCIRDMNSLNAHATGVIFPTNDNPSENQEYFTEKSISHKISHYNAHDIFYTFPVFVPKTDKESKYTEWKKIFDEQLDMALTKIEEKVLLEKKYAMAVGNYMLTFPSRGNL